MEGRQLCYWIGIDPSSAWVRCTPKQHGGRTGVGVQKRGDREPSWSLELGCEGAMEVGREDGLGSTETAAMQIDAAACSGMAKSPQHLPGLRRGGLGGVGGRGSERVRRM